MKTNIKIARENSELIRLVLREVNGRGVTHAYTDYGDMLLLITDAEEKGRELLGAQKRMPGLRLEAVSGRAVSRSYGYDRLGTKVILVRGCRDWFLESITQVLVPPGGGDAILGLTYAQDVVALARLRIKYSFQLWETKS